MLRLALAILFPLLLLPASADDLHDRFDKVVKELRSDDAAERDKGSAELEAIAKEAPELVRPLAEDKDLKVKARALEVLKRQHLVPETEAETLLRKVGDKYSEAKTLQYKVTIDQKNHKDQLRLKLSVAAKTGNLLSCEGTGELSATGIPAIEVKASSTCDGKNLVKIRGHHDERFEGAENAGGFVRCGVVSVGMSECLDLLAPSSRLTVRERFKVEGLKSEVDEKVENRTAKVVSYTVKVEGTDRVWTEKLWIDAEQEVLLKRMGTCTDGKTVTETYSDTKFDEDIPDAKFALPAEK